MTVLPLAAPRSLEIASVRVGPWKRSGGEVRATSPLSSRVEISSAVEAGEISMTPSGIVTERAVGIVSVEAQAPAMQLAPSATSLRAAWVAPCGVV